MKQNVKSHCLIFTINGFDCKNVNNAKKVEKNYIHMRFLIGFDSFNIKKVSTHSKYVYIMKHSTFHNS